MTRTPPLYPPPWKGHIHAGGQVGWLLAGMLGLFAVLFLTTALVSLRVALGTTLPLLAMGLLFAGFAIAVKPSRPAKGPATVRNHPQPATVLSERHWIVRQRVILPGLAILTTLCAWQLWQTAAWAFGPLPRTPGRIVQHVLVVVLLLGMTALAWRMVLRSVRSDAIILTSTGLRLTADSPELAWGDIERIEATARENRASRLPQNAVLLLDVFPDGLQPRQVRVDNRVQHPCVVLGLLEAYRSHPELRAELGTPASVERSRQMTEELATLTRFGPPS